MFKKILFFSFLVFSVSASARGFFDDDASLCVTNYSNTVVRVSEGSFFTSTHFLPPQSHEDIEPWGSTLYNVNFKYLASDGFYYPIAYCYVGDLYDDLTVMIYNSPYYPYYPYCSNAWG